MGYYSKKLSKKFAKSLVTPKSKKHPVFSKFSDPGYEFWMSKADPNYLHFGRGHLEGELKFNSMGRAFHASYKHWG